MADVRPIGRSAPAAGFVLGRQLDSIPFSAYHLLIIAVLALVGFIEGYDLVMTGSLLVLAKEPLNLTGPDIRWLAVGPTFMLCLGGYVSSAVSDHWSRKTVMLIGVIATTFFTLLSRRPPSRRGCWRSRASSYSRLRFARRRSWPGSP